jgi:hypothetical protein
MENWSTFIHEELFLIDGSKQATTKASSVFELGVIANNPTPEEETLLAGILKATQLDPQSVYRSHSMDSVAKTWLIFDDKLDIKGDIHLPLKKFTEGNSVVILAYPLSTLRSSQEEKGKLWGILKDYFNL